MLNFCILPMGIIPGAPLKLYRTAHKIVSPGKFISFTITLLTCFLFNQGFAQQPAISWTQPFTTKGNFTFTGLQDSNLVVIQNRSNKEVVSRSFTPALTVAKETSTTYVSTGEPASYLISFISDSGLAHIRYQYDKKKDQIAISGERPGKIQLLATMKANLQSFIYAVYSGDRSKLLICNFYFRRKEAKVEREFIVLSTSTGQVFHSGTFTYNFSTETSDEIQVDNVGNAYFESASYQRTGSKLSGKSRATQHVTVFSPNGRSVVFTIDFPGSYIPGVDIIQEQHNAVYIGGLAYDEATRATRISSADLFLYRIDSERLLYTDSVYVTVNGLYQEGRLDENDRLPYTIRHIYEKKSGELVVIAEQYQRTFNQYSSSEKYHDISCIRLKSDHSFGSLIRIPKLQAGVDNPSIISTFIHEKVFLFYNDLQENLDVTGEMVKYVANKKEKNGLFLITIDPDFRFKKELLYGYDSGQPMPVLKAGYAIDNRTIFLCSEEQVGLLKIPVRE